MSEMANAIMDAAEARIRKGGYGAFSFREIAADVGIKSSSVHYHFPTKEDLGAAVARRFGERFLEAVAKPPGEADDDPVSIYRSAFRDAIGARGNKMCLFGVLGAEVGSLPPQLAAEIHAFFRLCIEDLTQRIGGPKARALAFEVMATLEGGAILARSYDDIEPFDQATASLA